MKVLILAGGYGTRLSEETEIKPKPMVDICGKPILWHIMKIYSSYGFNDFVILLGYKGYVIKEFFANYFLHQSDITIDLSTNSIEIHRNTSEPWKVTLLDTGLETMTGGRIKRAINYIKDETFLLTYGDGVADVNITQLLDFHHGHKGLITVTAVQPEGRFGSLNLDYSTGLIQSFTEKPKGDGTWINGGFFVCEPQILNYISNDQTYFEREPLENMASDGVLYAYRHHGFWKAMDTLRDKKQLNELYESNTAPWKIW